MTFPFCRHCEPTGPARSRPEDRLREAISGQGEGGVDRVYCVYILTNQRNTVLYTGVIGDLASRIVCPWRLETARVRQLATMARRSQRRDWFLWLNAA
jgi:hypothetical protein